MGSTRVPAFIVRRAAACLAGACLAALCLAAIPAEGVRTYLADLAVPGGSLRLVLRLTDGGDATIDIPAQGIERMALEVTGGPGGALTMRIPVPVPAFMDLKEADGGLAGTFRQAAFSAPVSFRPGEPTRPQDPKPPLPYTVREVEVRHPAGHVLAGTLVVPPGASASARVPGVVFITGSGPQDRDESLMGHRPFLVIADALARRGIASLRCDDRGTGKSTGNFAAATSADFATDAAASFDLLAGVPEVDPARVGFLGHSEGGIVGPMAAEALESRAGRAGVRPAFVVLLAGPGVDGAAILKAQNEAILRAAGVGGDELAQVVAAHAACVDAAAAGVPVDELRAKAAAMVEAQMRAGGGAAAMDDAQRATVVDGVVAQMRAPWMLAFMRLDPAVALRRLRCPVLALFGERDLQVIPAQNEAPVAAALREAGVPATVRTMPGLNHLFQPAARGTIDEYASIDVTVDPAVLAIVGDWILAQPPRPPASR
ncbi:MAG: alpha/beta hydrolase family protein [Phycisphaerales bacterium]